MMMTGRKTTYQTSHSETALSCLSLTSSARCLGCLRRVTGSVDKYERSRGNTPGYASGFKIGKLRSMMCSTPVASFNLSKLDTSFLSKYFIHITLCLLGTQSFPWAQ